MELSGSGDLSLHVADGEVRLDKLGLSGNRKEGSRGRRGIHSAPRPCCFSIGQYDATRNLVIDPVLVYATFLGGASMVPRDNLPHPLP